MDVYEQIAIWEKISTISDPDEQIDFWAANSKFWGDPAIAYVALGFATVTRSAGIERRYIGIGTTGCLRCSGLSRDRNARRQQH
jgi:hypothetical protein